MKVKFAVGSAFVKKITYLIVFISTSSKISNCLAKSFIIVTECVLEIYCHM